MPSPLARRGALGLIATSLAFPAQAEGETRVAEPSPDLGGRTAVAVNENAYTPLNVADHETG